MVQSDYRNITLVSARRDAHRKAARPAFEDASAERRPSQARVSGAAATGHFNSPMTAIGVVVVVTAVTVVTVAGPTFIIP